MRKVGPIIHGIRRRISPIKIPNTTKIVSLIPDRLFLKLTFGKKYLVARAPGRNMVPMNNASMNRYPKLLRQITTNRMEAIQYDMTSSRFIINTKIANKQSFVNLNLDIGVLTYVRGFSAWMDICIILLLLTK